MFENALPETGVTMVVPACLATGWQELASLRGGNRKESVTDWGGSCQRNVQSVTPRYARPPPPGGCRRPATGEKMSPSHRHRYTVMQVITEYAARSHCGRGRNQSPAAVGATPPRRHSQAPVPPWRGTSGKSWSPSSVTRPPKEQSSQAPSTEWGGLKHMSAVFTQEETP